jgi:hypothetical protein
MWWITPTPPLNMLLGCVAWTLSTFVLALWGSRLLLMNVADLIVEIGQRINDRDPLQQAEQSQDEDKAAKTDTASLPAQP